MCCTRRICANGARFAEQVLQSSEPAQDDPDSGDDSDDEDRNRTDGSPKSWHQAVPTEAVATPAQTTGVLPMDGHPATEATAGAEDSAVSAAEELAACGPPEAAGEPQHMVARSAPLAASCTDGAAAATADSRSMCGAETPVNMEAAATKTSGPASLEAAPAAADAGHPQAADGAEAAAAPPVLSEADEQFEALCRALLAASQLITTVRPLRRLHDRSTRVLRSVQERMSAVCWCLNGFPFAM